MKVQTTARHGFTLIEIMIVVAIMAIVMTMSIPMVVRVRNRAPMNKAVRDVVEVCSNARAMAILQGKMTELVFHPQQRTFEVVGAPGASQVIQAAQASGLPAAPASTAAPDSGLAGQLSERIAIEMLDVNLTEYKDEEIARVRFYPNGTCDEMTLILHSDKGEWLKISLEITTSLASVGPVDR